MIVAFFGYSVILKNHLIIFQTMKQQFLIVIAGERLLKLFGRSSHV